MALRKFKKEDVIRDLLLKTVGRNPDLFTYYVSLQEAKELLGKNISDSINIHGTEKPKRVIADCWYFYLITNILI